MTASSLNLAQPLLSFPQLPTTAPQNYSSNEFSSTSRGIASLTFNGRTWRFRTNPNSVNFSYTLNTNVEQTFGGRVVQLLSCKIEDLVVVVEAGNAGWAYAANLALFLRDFLDYQRAPGASPGVFEYTTRRWKFNVYAMSIPFQDEVEATVRPLVLNFKVQDDVTGVVSGAILDATLAALQDGIGWRRDQYNSGSAQQNPYATGQGPNSGGPSGPLAGGGQIQPAGGTPAATALNIAQNQALADAPSAGPTLTV